MAFSDQQLCNGQTNTRTCTGKKNSLHDFENLFRVYATQYTCCNENDSYFNYRLDARRPAYLTGIATVLKNSCNFEMLALSRCGR